MNLITNHTSDPLEVKNIASGGKWTNSYKLELEGAGRPTLDMGTIFNRQSVPKVHFFLFIIIIFFLHAKANDKVRRAVRALRMVPGGEVDR